MKTVIRIYLAILFAFAVNTLSAQDLSTLKEAERNPILIQLSKETCLKRAPKFYREYGQPIITTDTVRVVAGFSLEFTENVQIGDRFYIVEFPYDRSKETMNFGFAFKVYIMAKTRKPFSIDLGNGYMYAF